MAYNIVYPETLYHGRSYSSLVQDMFNWYLSIDPDKRIFGPIVFLRSTPVPEGNRADGYKELAELNVSNVYADDPLYEKPYANNPLIRVGGEKLQIRKDQAIFIPIIYAYEITRKPFYDWGSVQDYTGSTIDYGDNPPQVQQLLIDGVKFRANLDRFRIVTPLFPVIIPEADYGRSVKDFLEESIAPGQYLAMVEGYFVLIKDLTQGTHYIYARSSAPRDRGGAYVAELLYEIKVDNRPPITSRGAVPYRPPRNQALINRVLCEKVEKCEITPGEKDKILRAIEPARRRAPPRRRHQGVVHQPQHPQHPYDHSYPRKPSK